MDKVQDKTPTATATENWQRYKYGIERGHRLYTESAKLLEGMYLGGGYNKDGELQAGGQWTEDDLDVLSGQGRPAYEWNEIMPAVNAALGYQIANRMDISFKPRSGDATKDLAEVRSKVAMQIAANNNLHWMETEVFSDGMIQQRGFYECRMDFDDSIFGEMKISVLDPMDVIPDPDAKSYDPQNWHDVIITRWMTLDEIEGLYGQAARDQVEAARPTYNNADFGGDGETAERNAFGGEIRYWSQNQQDGVIRYRIIDRQFYVRERMDVAVSPAGDVRVLSGDETPESIDVMRQNGFVITKRNAKRVRWVVSTQDTVLHDDWSPYDRFTVIPFFAYFRRGKTRGMVDNAVGPQIAFNKAASQAIHILNTTANSGYQVEQGVLTNMTTEQLARDGARTGLVIEREKGSAPVQKLQPNQMPSGLAEIAQMASQVLQDVTVPNAMRGITDNGESGIAIQSRQHASQQVLSVPLDNLARTRNLLARWMDYAMSKYYDTQRVFRITKTDPLGRKQEEPLVINQFDPSSGAYLNDMTAGEFDVVITEQPMQVTFENSQFTQVMEMRNAGINIPDPMVIRYSNLSDKHEIIAQMEGAGVPPPDPTLEAKAGLINAQAKVANAQAVKTMTEAEYAAMQAAQVIATTPHVAPIADEVMKAAGYQDPNPAGQDPNFPQPSDVAGVPDAVRQNTSPEMPPVPQSAMTGIETQRNDGVM